MGKGWHAPTAAVLFEMVIRAAAEERIGRIKANRKVVALGDIHECGMTCLYRITVKQLKENMGRNAKRAPETGGNRAEQGLIIV